MTIFSPSQALWVWPSMTALVFGVTAALISAQSDGAELFARVLMAVGAGLVLGLVGLLLGAFFRPGARPQHQARRTTSVQAEPDG